MNPLAWIQGLEGLTLALVICGLLFLEEVGVPLPFAPGDLLLAIAGIAVAAGRVPAAMRPSPGTPVPVSASRRAGTTWGLPAEISAGGDQGLGLLSRAFGVLATLGGLWSLIVLILQPAIWSQFLLGGFRTALVPAPVLRACASTPGSPSSWARSRWC